MKSLVEFITEKRQEGTTTFKRAFDVIYGIGRDKSATFKWLAQQEDLYNVKTKKTATEEELEEAYNSNAMVEWEYDTRSKDLSLKTNDFEFVTYIAPSETKYILGNL